MRTWKNVFRYEKALENREKVMKNVKFRRT